MPFQICLVDAVVHLCLFRVLRLHMSCIGCITVRDSMRAGLWASNSSDIYSLSGGLGV